MFKLTPGLRHAAINLSRNYLEVNVRNFHCIRRIDHILNGRPRFLLNTTAAVRCLSDKSAEVRYTGSGDAFQNLPAAPSLPAAPVELPELSVGLQETAAALAEPTLASMGMAGWTPPGLVQSFLEYLHVAQHIPWWGTIVIGTLCVRILIFPLVIKAQRNNANMNNNLPQIQVLQMKMTQARQTGNQLETARYSQEMMAFMTEKGLNPLKNMLVPLAQAPLFISFFVGLRSMANYPVDSLTTGGLLWFTDLTVPDQYYLLPIITSATLLATIELGVDGAKLSSGMMQTMRYVIRAIPIVMLPFTIHFPGAILCYWVSSNFISLLQVGLLKVPRVRDYFKIPRLIAHKEESLPLKKKGFVAGAKDSWTNLKLSREFEDRQRVDEMIFNKAGKGPLQKTFKNDPTKIVAAIRAKKANS